MPKSFQSSLALQFLAATFARRLPMAPLRLPCLFATVRRGESGDSTRQRAALFPVPAGCHTRYPPPPYTFLAVSTIIDIFNSLVPDEARGQGSAAVMLHHHAGDVVQACLLSDDVTKHVLTMGGATTSDMEKKSCQGKPCMADLLPEVSVADAVRLCSTARSALLAAVRMRMLDMCAHHPTCTNLNTDCGLNPSFPIAGIDASVAATILRRVAQLTAQWAGELFNKFDGVSKNGLEAMRQLVDSGGWPEPRGTNSNPVLFQPVVWANAWLPFDVGTARKDQLWPYGLTLTKIAAGRFRNNKIRTLTIKEGIISSYDPSYIPTNQRRESSTCSILQMPLEALRERFVITAASTLHTQPDLAEVGAVSDVTKFTISGRANFFEGKPVTEQTVEISFEKTPDQDYDILEWKAFICAMHMATVQVSFAAQSNPAAAAHLVIDSCRYLLASGGTTGSVALSRLADVKSAPMLEAGRLLAVARRAAPAV